MAAGSQAPISALYALCFLFLVTCILQAVDCRSRFFIDIYNSSTQLNDNSDISLPLPSDYIRSPAPMDSASAHRFCRTEYGGFLYEDRRSLGSNTWSDYTVRNGRLVQHTSTSPKGVNIDVIKYLDITEPVYSSEDICILSKPCVSRPPAICDSSRFYEFGSCDQLLHFQCGVGHILLDNLEKVHSRGSSPVFNINNVLDFNLQFSQKKATLAGANDLCRSEYNGSRIFEVSNDADRAILQVLSEGVVREFLSDINVSEQEVDTTQFWVNDGRSGECQSLALVDENSISGANFLRVSPCDEKQRVLCKVQRDYSDQTEPKVRAERGNTDLIRQNGNDILAHSKVLMQAGDWLQGDPLLTDNSGSTIQSGHLDFFCDTPPLSTRQGVTVFSDVGQLLRNLGPNQQLKWNLDFQKRAPSIADLIASFSCVYNSAFDWDLLTSNTLFVRPTDVEIFSVHFYLDRDKVSFLWGDAPLHSLTNTWPTIASSGGPVRGRRPTAKSTELFLNSLNSAIAKFGYALKPLELSNMGPYLGDVLVTYAYKQIQGVSPSSFEDIPNTDTSLKQLQNNIFQTLDQLTPLGVTKVDVMSIDWCWATQRIDDVTGNVYDLPTSRAPAVWKSSQKCADNRHLVIIECKGDKQRGFLWGPTQVTTPCDITHSRDIKHSTTQQPPDREESTSTQQLQDLALNPISPDNVNKAVENLTSLVESASKERLTPTDVNLVADILQNVISSGADLGQDTVEKILQTVDAVSRLPQDTLSEGQSQGRSSNRILEAADTVGSLVDIPDGASHQRVVSGGLGLEVWDLEGKSPDSNIIVGLKVTSDAPQQTVTDTELLSEFSHTPVTYDGTDTAIYLPEEFLRLYAGSQNATEVRLVMNVYKTTSLFLDKDIVGENDTYRTLNSKVIAAQLLVDGTAITNLLGQKVTVVFNPTRAVSEEERSKRTTCVYWDFSANQNAGGWRSDGCRYKGTRNGLDVCECDHLTNFAVLVTFYDQSELEQARVLGIITKIGLSLSIFGLTITIFAFLYIRKLQTSRSKQTLFQLSLALLLTWLVFLAGIEQTSNHNLCIAVAAILHYLILASFMWMSMQGLLQYLLFVRVLNTHVTHYMWKTSIPSWGLPIIPVLTVMAIDRELYKGGDNYCWMSLDAFYYSFVVPVGFIILANLAVFIRVTVKLCRRKDMSKHSSKSTNQNVVNIRSSFISFCVLGLTWIFGFLAIEDARLVFQYLFCITSTAQGFIIFIMMTARDKYVRQCLLRWFKCGDQDSSNATSSNSRERGREEREMKDKYVRQCLLRWFKCGDQDSSNATSSNSRERGREEREMKDKYVRQCLLRWFKCGDQDSSNATSSNSRERGREEREMKLSSSPTTETTSNL